MKQEKIINRFIEELLEKCEIFEPPVNVLKIANFLNIVVVKRPYKDKGPLSAMLVRNQKRVIIGVNESHNSKKQRFSIAHEIGHYYLHKGEELIVDRDYFINFRDYKSGDRKAIQEKEANYFASCLLMPYKFLIDDLKKYEADMLDSKKFEQISKDLYKKYDVNLISMRLKIYSLFH